MFLNALTILSPKTTLYGDVLLDVVMAPTEGKPIGLAWNLKTARSTTLATPQRTCASTGVRLQLAPSLTTSPSSVYRNAPSMAQLITTQMYTRDGAFKLALTTTLLSTNSGTTQRRPARLSASIEIHSPTRRVQGDIASMYAPGREE